MYLITHFHVYLRPDGAKHDLKIFFSFPFFNVSFPFFHQLAACLFSFEDDANCKIKNAISKVEKLENDGFAVAKKK